MSENIIPSDWRVCATCARWGGSRQPNDPFQNNIRFARDQMGTCHGGGFNQIQTFPLASCDKWDPLFRR